MELSWLFRKVLCEVCAGREGGDRAVGPAGCPHHRPPVHPGHTALPGDSRERLSSWCSQEGLDALRSERPAQAAQGQGEEHHLGQPQAPALPTTPQPPGIRIFWKAALLPCPHRPPPQGREPGPLCTEAVKLATSFCLSGNPLREKCVFKGFVFLANQREENKEQGRCRQQGHF